MSLKEYKFRDFERILNRNDYFFDRQTGDHRIFKNSGGRHVSVPLTMNPCIIRRLIKENNLSLHIK